MEFSYGIIAAVGVLAAITIIFIVMSPDEIVKEMIPAFVLIPQNVDVSEKVSVPEPDPEISIPVGTSTPGCDINHECYLPYDLSVPVGTTVIWLNVDNAAHTVTSGGLMSGILDTFDSGLMPPDSEYEFTFDEPGVHEYFCLVHPWMDGIVNVS